MKRQKISSPRSGGFSAIVIGTPTEKKLSSPALRGSRLPTTLKYIFRRIFSSPHSGGFSLDRATQKIPRVAGVTLRVYRKTARGYYFLPRVAGVIPLYKSKFEGMKQNFLPRVAGVALKGQIYKIADLYFLPRLAGVIL